MGMATRTIMGTRTNTDTRTITIMIMITGTITSMGIMPTRL